MDWIQELERLHSINHLILREPLPYIHVQYIFINDEKEIISVEKQKWHFSSSENKHILLSKEKILSVLNSIQKPNYYLNEILVFHIPLEPELLSSFQIFPSFLSSCSLDTLSLPPSLFIFHPFNTLYFLFQEKKLKPILSKGIKSHTKKSVHFSKRTTQRT